MNFEEFDISKLPSGEKATGWLEVASRADGGSWRLPLLYVKGGFEWSAKAWGSRKLK